MQQSHGCRCRWPVSLVDCWVAGSGGRQPPVTSEESVAGGSGAGISLAGRNDESEAGRNSIGQAVAGDVGQLRGWNPSGVAREMRHPCERLSVSNWSKRLGKGVVSFYAMAMVEIPSSSGAILEHETSQLMGFSPTLAASGFHSCAKGVGGRIVGGRSMFRSIPFGGVSLHFSTRIL